jgi:hypothetical protein
LHLLTSIKQNFVDPPELTAEDRRRIDEIETDVRDIFDVDVDLTPLIRNKLHRFKTLTPLFRFFLRQVDPEVVVAYIGEPELTAACQREETTMVHLQTRLITRYHPDFHFPGDRTKRIIPDYYFTWGEYWNDIAAYPLPEDRFRSIGFEYLERQRRTYRDVPQKNQVVFISQPTIGPGLSEFAADLAARNPDYDIVYNLHPREEDYWRKEYPVLEDADLHVAKNESSSLYRQFAASRAVVGVYSTALFESIGFDVSRSVVPLTGLEQAIYLLDGDAASTVETPAEMPQSLPESETPSAFDCRTLFRAGPVENFESEIGRIINEQD